MSKVFVLGSINVDLVFTVDRMPKRGETLAGQDFFLAPGGKGANQAVACARQGVPTWMIGSVGSDALSKTVLDSLQDAGVNKDYITRVEEEHTGVAGIFLEQSDNRIVIGKGANQVHDIDAIKKILTQDANVGDVLLCQLEIPMTVLNDILPYAKEQGLMVILNAAPAEEIPERLLTFVDLLVVNETELMTLTKKEASSKEEYKALAQSLLQQVFAVLVTLGEEGSFYIDRATIIWCDAFDTSVIDTTAAGDTYIGGYITVMLEDKSIKERLVYASASATLAIQTLGAQPSIPTRQQVLEYLQKEEDMNA